MYMTQFLSSGGLMVVNFVILLIKKRIVIPALFD